MAQPDDGYVEPYISKFTATKIRTLQFNYKRIFGLKETKFVTIDPVTFEVTNSFDYSDLKKLKCTDRDPGEFTFTCAKNGTMLWKTEFRGHLLTELVRLRAITVDDATFGLPGPFPAERIKRTGARVGCMLVVRPHALCETTKTGDVVSEYRYLQVQGIQLAEDKAILILYVSGRARVWAVGALRDALVSEMKKQATQIGLVLRDGPLTSVENVQQERAKYGSGSGVPLCTYTVAKVTKRHPTHVVNRKLTITDEWLVERDAATFKVISARPLSTIYALVRPWDEPRVFQVEFDDNASRTYQATDRDMVLGALIDAAHTAGNKRVFVSAEVSDGLRLTPRFHVEEAKKTSAFTEAFFGPDTIEGWHLKQLSKAAAAMLGKGKEVSSDLALLDRLLEAANEFNANVPVTGCDSATDKDKVTKAMAPLLAILHDLALQAEDAPDVGRLRDISCSTTTLLQALLRLALTVHGQKVLPKLDMALEVFRQLLRSREPFVAYWAVMVLSAVLRCPMPGGSRNTKQEYENKQALLAPEDLNTALVALLNDDKAAMMTKRRREGGSEAAPAEERPPSSALAIMAVSGLLESVLCSSKDTTSPERFDALLQVIDAEFYSLMSMLRSPCALIMENAALIMMTIHEHAPYLADDLRDLAMSETVLLRHFYLAIFSPSVDQRFVSRHLITLWLSGEPDSPQKALLSRMVPAGLMEYLKMPALTPAESDNLDWLEASESEFAAYARESKKGFGSMGRLRERINSNNAEALAQGTAVENFRVFFHTITQDHKLPDLIWNQQTRRELRAALEGELKSFETAVRDVGMGGVAWNHQQFKIDYPSLEHEVRVGKTYLRTFLEGGDAFITNIAEPVRFFDLLMRRVLVNFGTKVRPMGRVPPRTGAVGSPLTRPHTGARGALRWG
jgi:hypothetical protein